MDLILTLNETRVLGSLIEKEATTPEQYPLSLNALTNACNQKSNREPVLELSENLVQQTVDDLVKKHLVIGLTGYGSRVAKYQHRLAKSEFGGFYFNPQELALIGVLFLRGPQTPGELRTRTQRLCNFSDVTETEKALQQLCDRADGPFVVKLPRLSGHRESRYAHLFSGEVAIDEHAPLAAVQPRVTSSTQHEERITVLEMQVEALQHEVALLRKRLEALP